jgi:transposase
MSENRKETRMTKQHYNREFKERALALWQATDKSAREVEQDLGITQGLLYKWQKRQQQESDQAFRGSGKLMAEQERIVQLEREVAVLRQEREILKKVVAIPSAPLRTGFSNPKS